MRIIVYGLGYVGLSNAILLAQKNEVLGVDIDESKVNSINNKKSPLKDDYIIDYLKNKEINLRAVVSFEESFEDYDLIILALPTNYDEEREFFDTHYLDEIIHEIKDKNKNIPILIKSTIPIGYTQQKNEDFSCDNIVFAPEFLREGNALYDSLYPSRIIVSQKGDLGNFVANLYYENILNEPEILLMDSSEAEAVKLFANTYLAMRVSFFNELDNFAISKKLNTQDIIKGVCSDPRIGDHYNNPSFGYGGYCLPKDTKQLESNYKGIPNAIIKAIIDSNKVRKKFISEDILVKNPKVIGIYRLIMKSGSDNFRKSAIFDIISLLRKNGVKVVIYEPSIEANQFESVKVIKNLKVFKEVDLIIANRITSELDDVSEKVYTRDIFNRD